MSFWKSKKVAVTGAGGFIGSHLIEALVKKEATVSALIHYNSRNDWGWLEDIDRDIIKNIRVISGDLRDPFCVEKVVKDSDIVFHLGAVISIPYSYFSPWEFIETNIHGSLNVLEACKRNKVYKLIHTSTSEVYGTAIYTPIDENHPLQAQSPYSASKIAADKLVESYYKSYNLPVAIIRPFNTFGPRQSLRAVIPTIISQALISNKIKLGSLEPIRDFTYVEDTVEGFITVAESDKTIGEVVNIGNGRGIKINDLVKVILKIIGKDDVEIICEEKRIRPEKSEVYQLICDNKKALDLCNWKPIYSLEGGLNRTINWIKGNIGKIKSDIYNI